MGLNGLPQKRQENIPARLAFRNTPPEMHGAEVPHTLLRMSFIFVSTMLTLLILLLPFELFFFVVLCPLLLLALLAHHPFEKTQSFVPGGGIGGGGAGKEYLMGDAWKGGQAENQSSLFTSLSNSPPSCVSQKKL